MTMESRSEETRIGMPRPGALPGGVSIAPAVDAPPGVGADSADDFEGRVEAGPGGWIACDEPGGVVSICDPRLFRPGFEAFCRALAVSAIERFQARRVVIDLTSSTCRLEFEPGEFDREELARRVDAAVRAAIPVLREQVGAPQSNRAAWITLTAQATGRGIAIRRKYANRLGQPLLRDTPAPANPIAGCPNGAPRLVDLAMAGGSFTMVVAAAILPGIPTLPFLVMTARHTVRLSPRIERLLKRRPWAAALLRHAEDPRDHVSLNWRSLAKTLLITVLVAAALFVFRPSLPILIALEIAVMAFIGLRKLGGMEGWEVALEAAA
jgi:uncharacterized membrane protein YbaN (DUF454 family)